MKFKCFSKENLGENFQIERNNCIVTCYLKDIANFPVESHYLK